VDVEEVEPSGVNAHERGEALPVVDAAPALDESTSGVKPAGEAEKAVAAKSKALVPQAQGVASHEVERLPQKGGRKPEALPPESECELNASLRGIPDNGKRRSGREALPQSKCNPPPQRVPNVGALTTWHPGGKLLKERILESKGPIEAKKNNVTDIDASNKTSNTWPPQNKSVKRHHQQSQRRTWHPFSHRHIPPSRSLFVFVSGPTETARRRSGRCRGRDVAIASSASQRGPFGGRHMTHTQVTRSHRVMLQKFNVQRAATSTE